MSEFRIFVLIFIFSSGTLALGLTIGGEATYEELMEEAFNRGHAVQCLGETGYHWECN